VASRIHIVAVIVTGPPGLVPVTTPPDTEAMVGSELVHELREVTSSSIPQVPIAMAVRAVVEPTATVAVTGLTSSGPKGGQLVTLTIAVPETSTVPATYRASIVAGMPRLTAVTTPFEPGSFETSAIVASLDDQVTSGYSVSSAVDPSLNVPVATNACVKVTGTVAPGGSTAMLTSTGSVTVSSAKPVSPPYVALIVAAPGASPVARPVESIVAAAGSLESHVADAVTSDERPSSHITVAVKFCVIPAGTVAVAGSTSMSITQSQPSTWMTAGDDVTPSSVAVIRTTPLPPSVGPTTPRLPGALLTAATVSSDDAHAADSVTSSDVPSE